MAVRGLRGAITVPTNQKQDIVAATKVLLEELLSTNQVEVEDIAAIFFSVTRDLDQAFPAEAARAMGLLNTALLCFNEIDVPGGLAKCVRILMLINTEQKQKELRHVYLADAVKLRPDHSSVIGQI